MFEGDVFLVETFKKQGGVFRNHGNVLVFFPTDGGIKGIPELSETDGDADSCC